MSRIHSELGKLCDIAIEYLPEAKQFREQAKSFRLDEDDCGNPYAEGLWRIADEISTRPAATEQERAAARLLLAFITWELYEPSCPGLGYTAAHNEDACVALVPGIINIAKHLAEVTSRAISFMGQDVSAAIDWKQYLQDGWLPIEEKAYVIDDDKAYRGHLTRLADARTGCTVSDLLHKAENCDILLFAALRSFSAVAINTVGEKHPVCSWRKSHGDDVELLPMYARDIERFGQAELSHFPAELPDMGDGSLWFWRLDTSQTITVENLFIADGHVRVSPQAAAPFGVPATAVLTTFRPRIGWQIALFDAWPAMRKLHGREPSAAEAIRYLKKNDGTGFILPNGGDRELWWKPNRGNAKEVQFKTVETCISTWRTRGQLPA